MAQTQSAADTLFEVGKLYCERGDFDIAIVKLSTAADSYLQFHKYEQYLECQNLLLRMHAERDEGSKINAIKEELQELAKREVFQLNSRTYYTLGICSSYREQTEVALEYFQKALTLGLAADNKRDICYAINGIAITYFALEKYSEALKEIYNLQVFFQVMPLTDVRLSTQILNGHIQRKMKRFDQALEIFWSCYDVLREEKNMSMYLYLLYGMAVTYRDSGDLNLARMYLQLAKRSVDPKNMRVLAKMVDDQLRKAGVLNTAEFDLVFDAKTNTVTEKKKGRVDFKNQFILLDLLRLFMRQPGQVFSKESLVENVWKQEYDPSVHDNKIYVTIKRLRKMIEPDFDKPKYIFRAKNGYYLSKSIRVLMDH